LTDDERWYWQLDFGSKLTIVSTLCRTMALNTTRSGGIIVGFKDNLAKHIDIVDTDSKYVVWFKCSEQLFKTDQPVFIGVVYIPPEYTKYSSEDAFSELQQEYLSFSNKSKYICLLGDFNARTATATDFVDLI
jgi:hypothetical protein